jgi:hypothetical protein
MTNIVYGNMERRIKEIADRKIEILLETIKINECESEILLKLNFEYTQLDKEKYRLQLEMIGNDQEGSR